MSIDHNLPGRPQRRLVKAVRSWLSLRGIRPKYELWREAWAWAHAVALSYSRVDWPSPREIAAQYTWLLLLDLRSLGHLRLPYRAAQHLPSGTAARLGLKTAPKQIGE